MILLSAEIRKKTEDLLAAVQSGRMDRDSAGAILAEATGRPYVNLGKTLFQDDLIGKVPLKFAEAVKVVPLAQAGDTVTVAMADPNDPKSLEALQVLLGAGISPVFSFPDEIESAILVKYHSAPALEKMIASFDFAPYLRADLTEVKLTELVKSGQLTQIGDSLILLALKERASGIQIEPRKTDLAVRFRVDGVMSDRMVLSANMALPLAAHFKAAAGMSIAARGLPQEGRLRFALPLKTIEVRVSALPSGQGEKVVLRILGSLFTSDEFLEAGRADYRRALAGKFARMSALWSLVAAGNADEPDVLELERQAHGLAGSGATFGFRDLGVSAKVLELAVHRLLECHASPTAAQRAEIAAALAGVNDRIPSVS